MIRTEPPRRPGPARPGGPSASPELTLDDWAARIAVGHMTLKGMERPVAQPVSAFGHGTCHIHQPRPGLTITTYDVRYSADASISVEMRPHAYLGMLLEGWHEGRIGNRPLDWRKVGVPLLFASSQHLGSVGHLRNGQRCRSVGIGIDEAFFENLYLDGDDVALCALRRLLREPFVTREFEHAASLQYHLQDLADCPYTGAMACLHCESRALAVLVELTGHLDLAAPASRRNLRKDRRDRVHHVRHLVDAHLDRPLSMAEIARRVGSNETTLRLDFKAVFGTTIFAYIRDRRLDVARRLLRDGHLPIANIAYLTGYASPANFSTAYRKRFGVAPSAEGRQPLEV